MSSGEHPTHRPMSVWQIIFYWSARAVLWVGAIIWFRLWIVGLAHFPRSGGVLVVANHRSYLDPALLGIAIPRMVRIMAKIELFQGRSWVGRGFASLITWLGAFAVHRNDPKAAFEYTVGLLQQGHTIMMFPEGTRSETSRMERCKSGAIRAAILSGCTIVPTVIIGTHRALPKGGKFPWPCQIRIIFGAPYQIDYRAELGEIIPQDVLKKEVRNLAWRLRSLLPEELQPTIADMRAWYD